MKARWQNPDSATVGLEDLSLDIIEVWRPLPQESVEASPDADYQGSGDFSHLREIIFVPF